ncbi:MAG: hypothetical protein JWM78_1624 [Verrucomicrobiaceae bacterium]|nr:hypothetical protein [Verrucomicrobiaceae bacterium]
MFILDAEDLQRLTGTTQPTRQCKRLKVMGVPHRVRLDGHPIVTSDAVNEYTGVSSREKPDTFKINMAAISHAKKSA